MMNIDKHLLLVDDDHTLRQVLFEAFTSEGWKVTAGSDLKDIHQVVDNKSISVLLTDVLMPGGSALDYLEAVRTMRPDVPIVVMSAHSTLSMAVDASEAGAFDYLAKPFDLDDILSLVEKAHDVACSMRSVVPVKEVRAATATATAGTMPTGTAPKRELHGKSNAMQKLYRDLGRIVSTDLTVLVRGESGTGKELVARAIHKASARESGPFVAVNMAAIPENLIESELFGHEKGAFTGATHRRSGHFHEAGGGTLFLDEIGDMPFEAQTRLLRVLQEGEFRPVGSSRLEKNTARVIAATHADLAKLVEAGKFREDLYYRLNVIPIHVPPLRDRGDDIGVLAAHFLEKAELSGLPMKNITPDAIDLLRSYDWPGNVRELENSMTRLAALAAGQLIDVTSLCEILPEVGQSMALGKPERENADDSGLSQVQLKPETQTKPEYGANLIGAVSYHLDKYFDQHGDKLPPDGLYDRIIAGVEVPLINRALTATDGNQLRAAQLLGLNRNTLRKKIREHGLDPFAARQKNK